MPGELETGRVENMFFHIRFCFAFLSSGFIIFMFMFLHIVFFHLPQFLLVSSKDVYQFRCQPPKLFQKRCCHFCSWFVHCFSFFLPQFLLGSSKEWRINNISTRGHIKKRKKKKTRKRKREKKWKPKRKNNENQIWEWKRWKKCFDLPLSSAPNFS